MLFPTGRTTSAAPWIVIRSAAYNAQPCGDPLITEPYTPHAKLIRAIQTGQPVFCGRLSAAMHAAPYPLEIVAAGFLLFYSAQVPTPPLLREDKGLPAVVDRHRKHGHNRLAGISVVVGRKQTYPSTTSPAKMPSIVSLTETMLCQLKIVPSCAIKASIQSISFQIPNCFSLCFRRRNLTFSRQAGQVL